MNLYINTKDAQMISVSLKKEGEIVDTLSDNNKFGSQVLLPLIKRLLEKHSLQFEDLTGVEVETGPGSFTGIRVGVAVANSLAFGLHIPVNGKEIETDLHYS